MDKNSTTTPTIKGMFVNSHIKAVLDMKGEVGVAKLKNMYGHPINFKNMDDVPIREEVKIIECALEILHPEISETSRPFEAGRLHFINFSTTPLGKIMFSTLPKDFKKMMMRCKYIAQHVFRGVIFEPVDTGEKSVKVIMANNDYPASHFQGLFQEWMNFYGLKGKVSVVVNDQGNYEYSMVWA